MTDTDEVLTLEITKTRKRCAIGEKVGGENLSQKKIPVLSCEGACIRGEIARLAANIVAKEEPFRRACHGELLTIPNSSMTAWVRNAEQTVLIDGCFLRCHGRILENLMGKENLIQFDALSYYKKYTDRFDIDSVSEEERKETAKLVADRVLDALKSEEFIKKSVASD